jgi:hypothetical protein
MSEETKSIKRGRPVLEGSERQKRLEAREVRKQANGGEVKKGRPASPESSRQKKLAAKQAKVNNGEVVKRGRPKAEATPVEEIATPETEAQ